MNRLGLEEAHQIAAAVVPNPVLMMLEFHSPQSAKQVVERLINGEDAPVMIGVRNRFVDRQPHPRSTTTSRPGYGTPAPSSSTTRTHRR